MTALTTTCELFRRHASVFVDGELDPATQLELEQHAASCTACRDHLAFEHAYRLHVRDALAAPVIAPASLRERCLVALDREPEATLRSSSASRRYMVASAAAVLVVGVVALGQNFRRTEEDVSASLEDIVELHSSRLPADVAVATKEAEPPVAAVSRYFRDKVAFPVRPAEFESRDVRLVGARLSNVRARRAAALYYELSNGRRMTVVVTDAPMDSDVAEPVQLGNRSLFYRDVRGYPVPVRREAGLTYAFTGDADRDTLLRLAAQARVTYGERPPLARIDSARGVVVGGGPIRPCRLAEGARRPRKERSMNQACDFVL
ncbi:MAG: zf-HC2 domain-containing protein [Polyangiales bacterium]